ncbi:hypothetical protein [Alistipes ihumii]|jgi:hypothetical protein|uniref:hypothetical protein n=1 Tax=Alistipes ihumii TaxID=1470347 RepID=UPI00265B256A|nr:hypothetical protein [Alistipes ihumii]
MSEVTIHIDYQTLYENGFVKLDDHDRLAAAGLIDLRQSKLRLTLPQIACLRNVSYQRLRNFQLCGGFALGADNKLSVYEAIRLDLSMITDLDFRKKDGRRKRTSLKNLNYK